MSISTSNRALLNCEVLAKGRELDWEKIQNTAPNGTMQVENFDEQDEIIVNGVDGYLHMYLWEHASRWVVVLPCGC